MVQQKNVRKDSRLQRQIEELQKRMDAVEDILDNAKEVFSVEEAARFMDIARSSLYKMTSDRSIPFYRPNGKMRTKNKNQYPVQVNSKVYLQNIVE